VTGVLVFAAVILGLHAFFSGAEMAVVAADRLAIRRRAIAGSRTARILEDFLESPQQLLATVLVGTNLTIVTNSVVFSLAVIGQRPHAELLTVALLAPTMLVLGEIVPKTLGQQYADALAPRVAVPLRIASIAFWPLTWLLTRIVGAVTRLLKIDEPRALVTREELELLLRGPGAAGEITEAERRMIQRILDFRDATAGDVMVPLSEVFALAEDETLDEAAREVHDKRHTRIPIYRQRIDEIVGVAHSFDLLKAGTRSGAIGELGVPPLYAPESQLAVDLLLHLQRAGQGMAVVVNEYGGATGIVTVEDLLEQVVGPIEDEHDFAEPSPIRPEAPGVWRVQGRTAIAQVNHTLRTALPEQEEFSTLAGLILDRLKRIPRESETIRVGNVVLTVVGVSDRAIEEVRLRVLRR
jgi:CBS domain containing-hemolysin-like protein